MQLFSNGYIQIVLSSVTVYLFIIVMIRLFGKKELSQLSVVDLVFILLISNAVQNAMVGANVSLLGGLVAAGSLFVVNAFMKQVIYRFPGFGKLVQGQTIMLIYEGKLNRVNMARAKLSMDELMEALREHGVSDISDVDLAVLEVDGNVSVLSGNFQNKSTSTRKHKSRQGIAQKHG